MSHSTISIYVQRQLFCGHLLTSFPITDSPGMGLCFSPLFGPSNCIVFPGYMCANHGGMLCVLISKLNLFSINLNTCFSVTYIWLLYLFCGDSDAGVIFVRSFFRIKGNGSELTVTLSVLPVLSAELISLVLSNIL